MESTVRTSRVRDRLRVMNHEDMQPHRPLLAANRCGGGSGPLFVSFGDVDLVCGECSLVLIAGAPRAASIRDAVVECPSCRALNETWDAH